MYIYNFSFCNWLFVGEPVDSCGHPSKVIFLVCEFVWLAHHKIKTHTHTHTIYIYMDFPKIKNYVAFPFGLGIWVYKGRISGKGYGIKWNNLGNTWELEKYIGRMIENLVGTHWEEGKTTKFIRKKVSLKSDSRLEWTVICLFCEEFGEIF
jgi:hypothetical protein